MAVDKKEFDIKYEQDTGFKYLALEAKGSYSKIPEKITQLMQLTAEQNLFPAMRGPVFAIFHSDPREVAEEENFWVIGFPCAENINFKTPLKLNERKESFVAKCTVSGPYENLPLHYKKIAEQITNDGYQILHWSLERYLDDPREVKPEDLRTELWLDVKKSG